MDTNLPQELILDCLLETIAKETSYHSSGSRDTQANADDDGCRGMERDRIPGRHNKVTLKRALDIAEGSDVGEAYRRKMGRYTAPPVISSEAKSRTLRERLLASRMTKANSRARAGDRLGTVLLCI